MKSKFVLAAVLVLTLAILPINLYSTSSAAPKAEDNFELVKVADGVYAAIAKPGGLASGNAGFVIGDDSVLVFDTFLTPTAVTELIEVIGAQTKLPIKYAVNSHYHLDHTGGNQVLRARGVPIIAHDNLMQWQTAKNKRFLPAPADLEKRRADAAKQLAEVPADQTDKRTQLQRQIRRLEAMMAISLTNPTVTFGAGVVRLYLGNREVVLVTMLGHTGGDVLAYIPDANVVFMGDLGWSKTLPNLVDATVNEWIPTLDNVLAQHGTAKFVPGHGGVAEAANIRDFRDYLDDLRSRVRKGIADGLTIDQAKEKLAVPEKFKSFAFQNFASPNVEDMYKELKGTKVTN